MQLNKLTNNSKSGYGYSMNVSDISYLLGVGSICEPLLKGPRELSSFRMYEGVTV